MRSTQHTATTAGWCAADSHNLASCSPRFNQSPIAGITVCNSLLFFMLHAPPIFPTPCRPPIVLLSHTPSLTPTHRRHVHEVSAADHVAQLRDDVDVFCDVALRPAEV